MSKQIALAGGQPVRSKFLPLSVPLIGPEEKSEILDALDSGWISKGPKTHQFEESFKEYVGTKHAIAVSSCTAAMHVALAAAGIGEGDEVITCPMTFPATANVIVHQRATPVFVDARRDTLNIDVERIEEKITTSAKAIIPVHMAGQPCDMDAIMAIARKHNLLVIEDAAHAVGAEYKGKKVGTIGDVTAFSFYATKNLTTGDGGMITTNDDDLAEKMRVWSYHGMSADAWRRYGAEGKTQWELVYPGFKYNMTDLQAALGIHQLEKLDQFIEIREKYAKLYDEDFADVPEIGLPVKREDVRHAWHLYIIMLRLEMLNIDRDGFIAALKAENIGTGIHFIAVHLWRYYRETFGFRKEDYPNAAYISDRIISLPLCPKMREADVKDVITAVRKVIGFYRR